MSRETAFRPSTMQQVVLIALRTVIGWHFLYEGYYKLMMPGWSRDGSPLAPWTSAGYLKAATGPLARLFQALINRGWTPWIDNAVKMGLLLVGLSLILGLFTRLGCSGSILFLTLFYLLMIPTKGVPEAGNEGTYLIVNKTLIEGAAVCVLLAFNTGAIAGFDLLFGNRKAKSATATEQVERAKTVAAD